MNVDTCERNYGHDYESDGVCSRCGDYDEDYDEEFEDDEDEDDEVAKTWRQANGRKTTIYIVPERLQRAKELLMEHGDDETATTKILEILEEEFRYKKFSTDALNLLVIALRETEVEREAKRTNAKVTETGGTGMVALRVAATRQRGKRARLAASTICMIPDCGCDGTPHP